ncbi:MAG TPA: hypothetical protein VGS58_04655 [Candidatus Sulfopaludibacter sp.]|nr:hypothetical protein [Candidatus Sulfopaludibacter sp.]
MNGRQPGRQEQEIMDFLASTLVAQCGVVLVGGYRGAGPLACRSAERPPAAARLAPLG